MFPSDDRKLKSLILVVQKFDDGFRQRFNVRRIDKPGGISKCFRNRGDAAGDDWGAASHCLERRQAEAFIERRIDKYFTRRVEGAKIVVSQIARQAQAFADAR